MPGMWFELERIFAEEGVTIDKGASYYVGDAAGRASDFASTDRKFALNVSVQFGHRNTFLIYLQRHIRSQDSMFPRFENLPMLLWRLLSCLPIHTQRS